MIDTHSHIYLNDFKDDIEEVVARAKNTGVSDIILPNIDYQSLDELLKLYSSDTSFFHPLIGLHPTSVAKEYESELSKIFERYNKRDFIGIGEIGIDLYWDKSFIDEQIKAFQFQVDFAIQNNLPIIIHTRESFNETFKALKVFNPSKLHGVFHSFTGEQEEIDQIRKLGTFYFGINGIVTFKNARLRNYLNEMGLSNILLETDSPYLAPVPFRGKRNESSYLYYICKHIAEHLEIDFEEIAAQTTKNAKMLFNI